MSKEVGPCISSTIHSQLKRQSDRGNATLKIEIILDRRFEFQGIIRLAELLNEEYKSCKMVEISFDREASFDQYKLANLLAQTVNVDVTLQRDIALVLPRGNPSQESATLLYFCATLITSLTVVGNQEGSCGEVEKAIAALPNLRELALGYTCRGALGADFVRATLLEIMHSKNAKIVRFQISTDGFAGLPLGAFLSSQAATCLKKLTLSIDRFGRHDAIELVSGLKVNKSITDLTLEGKFSVGDGIDVEGLPILYDFWNDKSSIQSFHLDGYWRNGIKFGPLLSALAPNQNVTKLSIGGYEDKQNGKELNHLLCSNQVLATLDLNMDGIANLAGVCNGVAQGLANNRGLKALLLDVEGGAEDPPADLSGVIGGFMARNAMYNLRHLSFSAGGYSMTNNSWTSLTTFLLHPNCTLKTLELRVSYGKHTDIFALIGAIKQCGSLVETRLEFLDMTDASGEISEGIEIYSQIYKDALGKGMPNLVDLSVDLSSDPYELEFAKDDIAVMKLVLLHSMETNTQLECVSLTPMEDRDPEFDRIMNVYCLRNKTNNAAKALEHGTLALENLPPVLDCIEQMCEGLGSSTDLCFTNILFGLIKSRPQVLSLMTLKP